MTSPETVRFLSAVLLTSRQPERLAEFYRQVLGVPLEEERHGDAPPHWGCELGDIHFAIHPRQDAPERGPVRLAFWVFDLVAFAHHLEDQGIQLRYPVRSLGPNSLVTAIDDPDGNELELTQMGQDWVEHLRERRLSGADVLLQAKGPSPG